MSMPPGNILNTEDVAGALDAMRDAAHRVSGGSAAAESGARPGANDAIGEMRAAVLELHSSSEASFSRVHQIAELGARLGEDIAAVRTGFSAGALFARVVDGARSELERLGAEAMPVLEALDAAPGLESFAKRYTMQMEREVHERVASGEAIPSPEPVEMAEVVCTDGLGDNVELF